MRAWEPSGSRAKRASSPYRSALLPPWMAWGDDDQERAENRISATKPAGGLAPQSAFVWPRPQLTSVLVTPLAGVAAANSIGSAAYVLLPIMAKASRRSLFNLPAQGAAPLFHGIQHFEQRTDREIAKDRVTETAAAIDRVAVTSSDFGAGEVLLGDQLGDDPLGCPFGDPNLLGDVSRSRLRVACDAEKHVRMVG